MFDIIFRFLRIFVMFNSWCSVALVYIYSRWFFLVYVSLILPILSDFSLFFKTALGFHRCIFLIFLELITSVPFIPLVGFCVVNMFFYITLAIFHFSIALCLFWFVSFYMGEASIQRELCLFLLSVFLFL